MKILRVSPAIAALALLCASGVMAKDDHGHMHGHMMHGHMMHGHMMHGHMGAGMMHGHGHMMHGHMGHGRMMGHKMHEQM